MPEGGVILNMVVGAFGNYEDETFRCSQKVQVCIIVCVQCKVVLKHLCPMLGQINVFHRQSQNRITCGPPQGVPDKISATDVQEVVTYSM